MGVQRGNPPKAESGGLGVSPKTGGFQGVDKRVHALLLNLLATEG